MTDKMEKILIANRGEIAVRIIRACRDAGIKSAAVYSECDRTAYHVRLADEVYYLGPSPARDSYLNQNRIIEVAGESGSDAIHPGYGFLAENARFARLCHEKGFNFIGPEWQTIALLGDKLEARRVALKAGLPVVPGTDFDLNERRAINLEAKKIGYPVLIKAAAGGGGKGMRIVRAEEDLAEAAESAIREAASAFADGRVYLEKYLERPRHVEIQILADKHGNVVYLGERECSIQRRHQKVIEESPSPIMTEELRRRMGQAAVNITRESGYIGAGTVEFLVDQDLNFYFLEVNTRLQVEHPVTEMVTGIDLVREQFRIAAGRPLSFGQKSIQPRGHAIECRIYAEDARNNFMPSTGTISQYREPSGPGIRVDSGVVLGSEIPVYYDPIIAKLITWGADRAETIERTRRALMEYRVGGVRTTIGFACAVMRSERFSKGDYSTGFIDEEPPDEIYGCTDEDRSLKAAIAALTYECINRRKVSLTFRRGGENRGGWVQYYRGEGVKRLNK
jgi:acetyl-CoA carboxylase biotin carboxylase subunit